MPAAGLLALIDDLATMADSVGAMAGVAARKGVAQSKDVATLTGMAAKKTTGVVTDDMAVTAEQAIGIPREREIPVVLAVAKGSFKNKALFLAPGALLLNAVAPWAITPVLMAGGAFLCFEGVEKVIHKIRPHDESHGEAEEAPPMTAEEFERSRVEGAIRTDLILSGEIIAISLGEVAKAPFATQALTLYGISVIMTIGVYGVVGGLVKIDDLGELMARAGTGPRATVGRLLLAGAPKLLHLISYVGTVAMLLVGGHILVEGIHPIEVFVHHTVEGLPASGLLSSVADVIVGALGGLVVYGVMATGIPAKAWAALKRLKR